MTPPLSSNHARWPLALRLAAIWLVFVAWSSCAGWILSWCGQLNRTGYLVALIPLAFASAILWKKTAGGEFTIPRLRQLSQRPAAAAWLLVALISLTGGILYAPSNYDALSYRLPRILYWLQENRWYWLEDADARMNYSGIGFEWQMLPWIIFSGGDRLLFLLNWIPFLLFPALTFLALRTCAVGNSTAARWMWIIPLCYGFTLQASSIGNDGLGGILVCASLALSGFAEKHSSLLALALSAIAAAALSGLKASNLPLILPLGFYWLRAAWHMRTAIRGWELPPAFIAIALTSFLPLAFINHVHCGSWAGDPENDGRLRITQKVPGMLGNAINTVGSALETPSLPLSPAGRQSLLRSIGIDQPLLEYIKTGFPRFEPHIGREIPIEESAGIGIGVTMLVVGHYFQRRRRIRPGNLPWISMACTAISVVAFMANMGSENTARLMLPYYPVMIAALLAISLRRPPHASWARASFAFLPLICILPGLILNPNRPLIPLSTLAEIPAVPDGVQTRILKLEAAYSSRSDPLHAIRADLPPDCREVGFAGSPTQSAYSLFKPFGSRRVVEVNRANVESFEWLVAAPIGINERIGKSWDEWLPNSSYVVARKYHITFTAQVGPEEWYLLHRKPE